MRPVAVRPSNVQLLETLAAGHGLPDSNLKPAHPHGVRRVLSSPTDVFRIKQADALPPSEDVETVLLMRRDPHNRRQLEVSAASSGPPPFDRHGTSPFEQAVQPDDGCRPIRSSYQPCHDKHDVKGSHRYSARELDRHRSYDVAPTQPHQAWRSGPQRNNLDYSDFGLQSPPGNKVYHRQWNPSPERRISGVSYRRTLDGHYRSQSPGDTHNGCGGDVYSGLSTAPAMEPRESPFSDTGAILDNVGGTALTSLPFSPSRAYGTPLKPSAYHPPPNLSPPSIANRRSPFTLPISNNRSRRHPPLTGPWHKVLGSPSPPAVAEEWSTLPKRPHRMTLHPDASHPKRSKFRLPINLLSGRKMPQGRSQSPSPSNGLYSGAVTITKWSPSALSQPPERSVPQCRYVPPGMRALEMGSSREPPRDHQLPRAVNTSYITPRSSRVHPDSYAPSDHPHLDLNRVQSRTTAAYPTPRSIMPSPASEAGEERDKDDDWAMAWRLSANGRGAIRPSR
ncbi:hypothetical protein CC85DRAFT_329239 [Cutaneotrichosporon oleaginosum]|uniref:Uncharacterized protein n=1 Tax=Cutaneotrichosporon oleaginosum TaxID=879819 RepID=A0A0J0XJL9_9TREE|nr:uncharacterized protein CC85DRAFT_329239 [Cutaneotrichosporon oleaginosum]KLT41251.1 hypothetical protein CC85DRAFT_329239 [Cutaneotrichosporon oleaginosum]TXT05513.1 hypothetical protein COLE_06833 [Cutaneotrichosporon oleaginosum]